MSNPSVASNNSDTVAQNFGIANEGGFGGSGECEPLPVFNHLIEDFCLYTEGPAMASDQIFYAYIHNVRPFLQCKSLPVANLYLNI